MTEIKIGDKIKVVRISEGCEDWGYEVGDVYTVSDTYDEGEDGLILDVEEALFDLYASEVELFDELKESLTQAIENKIVFGEVPHHPHGITPAGKSTPSDVVSHPSHYTQGRFEVIEIIEQTAGGYSDGFTAHCVGTATKYLNRAPFKHETPLEDLRKAAKYLEFAIAHEEKKRL